MKRYATLVLASALTISMAAFAQEQTPPPGRKGEKKEFRQAEKTQVTPEKKAERMAKELGLTNAEKVKVQALFEKQEAVRSQHKVEIEKLRKEHMAKFETERKAQDAELMKIIGKEKFQKLEKERAEMKASMMVRHQGMQRHMMEQRMRHNRINRGEHPQVSAQTKADKMAKVLGLTDTEKAKVQALFEKLSVKEEQLKAEVKKFKEEKMAQFETERKSMNADLEKAIGTEKYQKLEAKKSEMMAKMKERRTEFQHHRQGMEWQKGNHKEAFKQMVTPEKRSERMAKELELTDAQKSDLQALFIKQDILRQQQKEKIEKMKAEMKEQFEAQRKTDDEALVSIIGQDNFQKLQALHAKQMADMKDRMKDRMKEMKKRHENHAPESNGDIK